MLKKENIVKDTSTQHFMPETRRYQERSKHVVTYLNEVRQTDQH